MKKIFFTGMPMHTHNHAHAQNIIVSGAGFTQCNGIYEPVGTLNGRTLYQLLNTPYQLGFGFMCFSYLPLGDFAIRLSLYEI